MLEFDVNYFKEETRNGFTIPAFMKHAWASELELLAKVDRICTDHDIPYFANWGTLLGTVRHKGFIPWDDDLDLCMKRADLNRFCEVIDDYDGILIQTPTNTPDHGFHASRVMNDTIYTVERDAYKDYHGFPFPVGLDIFTLDYVTRDKKQEEEQVEALQVCSSAYHELEWLEEHSPLEAEYVSHLAEYKAAVKWLEVNCGMHFSEENPSKYEITILHDEIKGLYGEEDADFLTEMNILASDAPFYVPKDAYDAYIRLPFENTTMPVPLDYEFLLRSKYGSAYMTPMNVEAGHEYPFYNAFIRAIYNEPTHKSFEGACEYIENVSSRFYVNFLGKTDKTYLDIDDKLLESEDIGGRHITTEDKRYVAAALEVLEEFKRLCEIAKVKYYAVGPWSQANDDDRMISIIDHGIHVAIKREDASAFIIALPQYLDAWYNYSTIYSHSHHQDMSMIIRSDSYLCDEAQFMARFHGCESEVAIYVSLLDYVDPDTTRDDTRRMLIENLITTSTSMPDTPPYSDEVMGIVAEWERIAGISVNTELDLKREFLRSADRIAGLADGDGAIYYRLSSDLQAGIDTRYPIEAFDEAINHELMGCEINIPMWDQR